MSDWPSIGGLRYQTIGTFGANVSRGTIIKCATANTKGSFGDLTPSSPFDAQGILLHISHPSTACGALVDVGIGPKDSEQVLIPNVHLDNVHSGGVPCSSWYFPVEIPANTRIAARVATSTAANIDAMAVLVSQDYTAPTTCQRVLTYGATTASSRGTSIDCGATANVKGSWVEIAPSLGMDTKAVLISIGGVQNSALSEADFLFDIGVGIADVETPIISNLPISTSVQGDTFFPRTMGPFPCAIPANQRVSVRAQCSTTDASDRVFSILLHFVG